MTSTPDNTPSSTLYPIGTPGQPWGEAERAVWRARQVRQRNYAHGVLHAMQPLVTQWDTVHFGDVFYGDEAFALMALRSQHWMSELPSVLVTGGVHGYETSGVDRKSVV